MPENLGRDRLAAEVPGDNSVETEAFLIVADADGSNARTIASAKTDDALDMPLRAIDWR